jgi:tryptophan synthase alpha chain
LAAVAAGADIIELGVPFSDPMADGPVLQRASGRARAAGATLVGVLDLVGSLRRDTDVPIVLFGYYNPFFRYGDEALARDAAAIGVDGILCVDLPPEEAETLRTATTSAGIDLIAMLAPTTPASRVRWIARHATGFLYFVSVLGVTGARGTLPTNLPALVERARCMTPLPIGVGFGVQTPEQAGWIAGFADAVVIGSQLARFVEQAGRESVHAVGAFIGDLRTAIDDGARGRRA